MSSPAPSTPSDSPARPAAGPIARGSVRGALLLTAGVAVLAALLALPFTEMLAAAGPWAAPLAAALAIVMAMLPLALLMLKLARQVQHQREQLARLAGDDAANSVLPGRAYFVALVEREWARARRYGAGAAVLLVDVDRFRRLASSRGADAAEALLHQMARHTASSLRGGDALALYGDGQFAVFLAHADPTGALDAAERIRDRLEKLEVDGPDQPLRATVSVGVATLRPTHQTLAALLDDALLAAAAAGQAGGNCVRAAPIDSGRLQAPGSSVDDNQPAGPF